MRQVRLLVGGQPEKEAHNDLRLIASVQSWLKDQGMRAGAADQTARRCQDLLIGRRSTSRDGAFEIELPFTQRLGRDAG